MPLDKKPHELIELSVIAFQQVTQPVLSLISYLVVVGVASAIFPWLFWPLVLLFVFITVLHIAAIIHLARRDKNEPETDNE